MLNSDLIKPSALHTVDELIEFPSFDGKSLMLDQSISVV